MKVILESILYGILFALGTLLLAWSMTSQAGAENAVPKDPTVQEPKAESSSSVPTDPLRRRIAPQRSMGYVANPNEKPKSGS